MAKKKYILRVVRTRTVAPGWRIESNLSLRNWAGAESEGTKRETVKRANTLASNLSKKEGVSVTVEVYSASGTLQTEAEW